MCSVGGNLGASSELACRNYHCLSCCGAVHHVATGCTRVLPLFVTLCDGVPFVPPLVWRTVSVPGKGTGKALMQWAEAFAKQHHCTHMTLAVATNNRAVHLYERVGYSITGTAWYVAVELCRCCCCCCSIVVVLLCVPYRRPLHRPHAQTCGVFMLCWFSNGMCCCLCLCMTGKPGFHSMRKPLTHAAIP